MAGWVLIPALKSLFAAFDQIAPKRDKASDGSIGDAAHRQEVSDHNADEEGSVPIHDADKVNEVHAIDVTSKLNEPGLTMEMIVQFLLARCRSGAEKRLRYIIYNRRIWSASSGWVQKAYTGASPHTEHAHFSASYTTSLEALTASWHLEDIPVAMTAADRSWVQAQNTALLTKIEDLLEGGAVARGLRGQPNNLSDTERIALVQELFKRLPAELLAIKIGDKANPNRTIGDLFRDLAKWRGIEVLPPGAEAANATLDPASPLARLFTAADVILATAGEEKS